MSTPTTQCSERIVIDAFRLTMEPSITPAEVTKPLSDFKTIGYNTYLWTSAGYTTNDPLIVLFAWNAAAAKHIAKYTISYQKLFPSSRILLVRCWTSDMFRRTASYSGLLEPAMGVVYEHTQGGGKILVHSFSNGGGNQLNEFAKAWKQKYGSVMPMVAQIMDSSPTKGPWMKSHAAITAGLPKSLFWRVFGSAMVHLLLMTTFVFYVATRRENKMVVLCRQLNDEQVFDKRVPRTYLYSRADQMVGFEEVEEHAAIAKRKGWDVTMVQFANSAHCGHVREDEAKYWASIMQAWRTA
jgi:hypothetical protein